MKPPINRHTFVSRLTPGSNNLCDRHLKDHPLLGVLFHIVAIIKLQFI